MQEKAYLAKSPKEMPIFCHPIALFIMIWVAMLVALQFHISVMTYSDLVLPISIAVMSVASFAGGYKVMLVVLGRNFIPSRKTTEYKVDLTRFRWLMLASACVALLIVIMNLVLEGPPPIVGELSLADAKFYQTYGRLKQLLFPLLVCVLANSFLDPRKLYRFLFIFFSAFCLYIYVTRGNIVTAVVQGLFIFALTTKWSKATIRNVAFIAFCGVAVLFNLLGNTRSEKDEVFNYLSLRPEFEQSSMIEVWIVAYMSTPLSNLCWIIEDTQELHPEALQFLTTLAPTFLVPADISPYKEINDIRIVDGVHTYLADEYIAFGWVGMIVTNMCMGMGAAWIMRPNFGRRVLTYSVFMSCIGLMFFTNNFFYLSTVVQFALNAYIQRRCITQVKPGTADRLVRPLVLRADKLHLPSVSS